MLRRLFTVLSALSLLLCVAVVVLWVRSYWRWDRLFQQSTLTDEWAGWMTESASGSLTVGHRRVDGLPSGERRWDGCCATPRAWRSR